jgi:hypothetical protein
MALSIIPLWAITDKPLLAIALAVTIHFLALAPTLRKSWHQPWQESLNTAVLSAVRHSFMSMALEDFNLTTALFPVAMVGASLTMSALLISRRRVIARVF